MYMERTITHYTISVEHIDLFSSHDCATMDVIELSENASALISVTAVVKHTLVRVGSSDGSNVYSTVIVRDRMVMFQYSS